MDDVTSESTSGWQVPAYDTPIWRGKKHNWCVVIPVLNEGERIRSLLLRMDAHKISDMADIIIIDGGSTDNSLDSSYLKQMQVAGLLIKTGNGKLSAQLRCAYAFALIQGYEGIVTIDGNDKDDPEAIPRFIDALGNGFDFVQGSRFIRGGSSINTPKSRYLAIRLIHSPCLSLASGFKWTDTTQGFRAYSRRLLMDPKLALFRDRFSTYELLAYLSYRAPRLGYKCVELPTTRRYTKGFIPTKINGMKGNLAIIKILLEVCLGKFNKKS